MDIATAAAPTSAASLPPAEQCWQSVCRRDRAADGVFWYGVRTTGVFCRPSCAARRPNRAHVSFHATPAAARSAGLRPCLRCRPESPDRGATLAAQACRRLDAALQAGDPPPDLAALAAEAGLSPAHFHRVFKAATGLTPRGYAAARRAGRLRAALPVAAGVTAAIYEAGYGSSRQFYAAAEATLGMPAAAYRAGGRGTEIRVAAVPCTLGALLVAATARGLCAIRLGDTPEPLLAEFRRQFAQARLCDDDPDFAALLARVVALVDQPGMHVDLPLDIQGTAFQQRVWAALRAIPAGTTTTYTAIAAQLGMPRAVRAVGAACGANPVSLVVPCHRVLRRDGHLAGYAWGLHRKAELLRREAAP